MAYLTINMAEGNNIEQKGDFGLGGMDGGKIEGNAKVAGQLEENNNKQSQQIVNEINIHSPNELNSSKKEVDSTENPKLIKFKIREGDKKASLETPYTDENFQSLLGFLQQSFNDDSIKVKDIEPGSIKLILEGSKQGLENIVASFRSGELAPLLKQQFNLELEDAQLIDYDTSDNYSNNQHQKLLAFTIAGNVSQSDIDILKTLLVDNLDGEAKIKNDKRFWWIEEIRTQGTKGRNLIEADLSGADLSGADLSGADLSGADLSGADLSGANLSGANLSGANLSGANLSGANLIRACLSDADLRKANLNRADLRYTDLRRVNLNRANLNRADLSDADLSDADLSGADVENTRFGDNKGIVESVKLDLVNRGANFPDSPGDRSEVLTRV